MTEIDELIKAHAELNEKGHIVFDADSLHEFIYGVADVVTRELCDEMYRQTAKYGNGKYADSKYIILSEESIREKILKSLL